SDQIERAAACKSAEELQALAATEGIELTDEEAEAYFAELNDVHVSDDELDAVSGGKHEALKRREQCGSAYLGDYA
ncbi:MAG: hypothetical protein IJU71_06750, partial [Selenomonadaceae bacterium]|nr:hypothetical protein [Selenomonadaceae bacterium]